MTTNNDASTFVTVRKGGVNVLYLVGAQRIGGGPGTEQRFVRAALAQSPDIIVERRLLNYQPMELDLKEELAHGKFDVVILDDVDAQALNMASWQALADRVHAGVGLMMTGGYHSFGPGGFRETPLADVLPLSIGPAQRQNFGDALRSDVQLPPRCGCGRRRHWARGIRSCKSARPAIRTRRGSRSRRSMVQI